MAKIFISYSNKDTDLVKPYVELLNKMGHEILMDITVIMAGDDFQKTITEALHSADGTISFLTENGLQSKYVISETSIALSYVRRNTNRKFLIPLVDELISNDIPTPIRDVKELYQLRIEKNAVNDTVAKIDESISIFLNSQNLSEPNYNTPNVSAGVSTGWNESNFTSSVNWVLKDIGRNPDGVDFISLINKLNEIHSEYGHSDPKKPLEQGGNIKGINFQSLITFFNHALIKGPRRTAKQWIEIVLEITSVPKPTGKINGRLFLISAILSVNWNEFYSDEKGTKNASVNPVDEKENQWKEIAYSLVEALEVELMVLKNVDLHDTLTAKGIALRQSLNPGQNSNEDISDRTKRVTSSSSQKMKINQAGIELIKKYEGFQPTAQAMGRLFTIGYGTTEIDGEPVKAGITITEQQAEEYLKRDLEKSEQCVSDAIKSPLNSNQFSALVSLGYNVGCSNLKRSNLAKLLNSGDYNVGNEFEHWSVLGGKINDGLGKRRQAERELFEKPEVNEKSGEENDTKKAERLNYKTWVKSEGNHEQKDQLDFENDIESLASIIAMKEVKAPLAIGLFGKWGSGKSFFMKKLKSKITQFKNLEDETYLKNIVHVEFNSWHYSDTSLWASMVTKIFDTLDQYSKGSHDDEDDALSEEEREKAKEERTAKKMKALEEQKETIKKEKEKLEAEIKENEKEQEKKRNELSDITGFKILKLILTDKYVKKDFSELNNRSVENIISDGKKLESYADEVKKLNKNILQNISSTISVLKSFKGKWWIAAATVGLIFLVKILGTTVLKEQYELITEFISLRLAGIITLAGNLVGYYVYANSQIATALKRAQSFRSTLSEGAINEDVKKQLAALQLDKENKVNDLINIEKKIAEATKDIEDVESGKRLLEFVEQRSKAADYANQLTLISWIRKDFENLSRLLRGQNNALKKIAGSNDKEVVLKVERIILYIDDLDRCNEDIVVKVLEAIHLILAFDLFVVIVGVDPRWLNNALNEKYKMLFGSHSNSENADSRNSEKKKGNAKGKSDAAKETENNDAEKKNEPVLEAATSYDYLEKIFQIPFCLKPINSRGRKNLIWSLIENEVETDRVDTAKTKSTEKNSTDPQPQIPTLSSESIKPTPVTNPVVPIDIENKPIQPYINLPVNPATIKDQKLVEEKPKPEPPIKVKFSKAESEFMQNISALFGKSPRSINRYVNIYRIIKAHKSFSVKDDYDFDEYGPTLFLLGIIVGHSLHASDFIEAIKKTSDDTTFESFLESSNLDKKFISEIRLCASDEKLFTSLIKDYKRNINIISRFSFRTLIDEEDQ